MTLSADKGKEIITDTIEKCFPQDFTVNFTAVHVTNSHLPVLPTGLMQYSLRVKPWSRACCRMSLLNMSDPVKYSKAQKNWS
jgi:hypothetical protein